MAKELAPEILYSKQHDGLNNKYTYIIDELLENWEGSDDINEHIKMFTTLNDESFYIVIMEYLSRPKLTPLTEKIFAENIPELQNTIRRLVEKGIYNIVDLCLKALNGEFSFCILLVKILSKPRTISESNTYF